MKPIPDHEKLLADVLAEDTSGYSHESLLQKTLLFAKRRRQVRALKRGAGLVTLVGLVVGFLWKNPQTEHVLGSVKPSSFVLIRTQPLPASAIIKTRQLAANGLVASHTSVKIVHTDVHGDGLRLLTDRELLAMLDSRPVVLVQVGPGASELIFANPADQNGFPLN
jgi:hypothetical protein